jgi:hypothetical protein
MLPYWILRILRIPDTSSLLLGCLLGKPFLHESVSHLFVSSRHSSSLGYGGGEVVVDEDVEDVDVVVEVVEVVVEVEVVVVYNLS